MTTTGPFGVDEVPVKLDQLRVFYRRAGRNPPHSRFNLICDWHPITRLPTKIVPREPVVWVQGKVVYRLHYQCCGSYARAGQTKHQDYHCTPIMLAGDEPSDNRRCYASLKIEYRHEADEKVIRAYFVENNNHGPDHIPGEQRFHYTNKIMTWQLVKEGEFRMEEIEEKRKLLNFELHDLLEAGYGTNHYRVQEIKAEKGKWFRLRYHLEKYAPPLHKDHPENSDDEPDESDDDELSSDEMDEDNDSDDAELPENLSDVDEAEAFPQFDRE